MIFLIMKQKTRFKNFGNIGYRPSAHEWPIYRYRPQKSHIGRFLLKILVNEHCYDKF